MPEGWIRAYEAEEDELSSSGEYIERNDRAQFRRTFRTPMMSAATSNSNQVKLLQWGDKARLPNGLAKGTWTRAISGNSEGYVKSAHIVEIAYVKKKENDGYAAEMMTDYGKRRLLWGDVVQITKRLDDKCEVRVRGQHGEMDLDDLTDQPLLEVYFIDVGQGDGVLVKTPDGRHLLIDGGLERKRQQTGKNAADFVDWKFFFDYGDFMVRLDSMMASHSDSDHYGGLHDLVRDTTSADRELDCLGVEIATLHHPGLSRWQNRAGHKDGLGLHEDDSFVQLLDDRADAEQAVVWGAAQCLSYPWRNFIKAVLENDASTKVKRVLVERDKLTAGNPLPKLWPSEEGCDIWVLGPVAHKVDGKLALKDLGPKSINTNGHSICLRIDFGRARILLTGDLNKDSMDWLAGSYGSRIGAWACDVAKACHHGSHDISYSFLEEMRPAATIISSGDAEGYSHPRPEIVGASAMTGFVNVDRANDRLITPLVYMTEIERSVSLGALNRIDFRKLPAGDDKLEGAILGRFTDEMNDRAFLTPDDRKEIAKKSGSDASDFAEDVRQREKPKLKPMESDMKKGRIVVDFNLSVAQGPVTLKNVRKRAWRSRVMEKNHYGLVNVRTDGETIVCATLDETEKKWVTHAFPARLKS